MAYMLDTSIVSDLVRHPRTSPVRERIARVGADAVAISVIVAAELRYGLAKGGSARLRDQLRRLLGAFAVLPFAEPADRIYADLRVRLERAGQPLGANDLLIAAHALAEGRTLITADRGFARIADLRCENWRAAEKEG
jgi:tRNA(fMet)-specific endonuclease VapC